MRKTLKIFIYNHRGEMVEEYPYAKFLDIYRKTVDHNKAEGAEPWNIYAGSQFPPTGFKWNDETNQFEEQTLEDRFADGDLDKSLIPEDYKVVGDKVVPKTLRERYDSGLLELSPLHEVVDDSIVRKSDERLYAEGHITWEQVVENAQAAVKRDFDDKIKSFLDAFPENIIKQQHNDKRAALDWLSLSREEREGIHEEGGPIAVRFALLRRMAMAGEGYACAAITSMAEKSMANAKRWD